MTPGANKRNICTGALDYFSPLVVILVAWAEDFIKEAANLAANAHN